MKINEEVLEEAIEEVIEEALDGEDIFTERYIGCGTSEKTLVDISNLSYLISEKYLVLNRDKKINKII